MEIIIYKDGASIAYENSNNRDLKIGRRLYPSPLWEEILFVPKKGKVKIFFILQYGETILLKIVLGHMPLRKFERMKKRINNIIENNYKGLKKYCENKIKEYERKLYKIL